ncbi:MAG: hypothetical protein GVY26_01245 [Bacteroidetes bacterium]|jgi:hypothetical protein|nr:hypothetical protein [Bacteroidota bacterium]
MKAPLMISCKKAAVLTEKKLLRSVTRLEALQLSLHRMLCKACRLYGVQSHEIDALLDEYYRDKAPTAPNQADSEALKQQIKEKIKNL